MQISSSAGMQAAYTQVMQRQPAQVNPELNAAATQAAAQANAAMYGLIGAVGGAQEAVMEIASGELASAVDIMA